VTDAAGRPGSGRRTASTSGPTLAQVARLAGVSIGTASKALNGQGQLRAQTRHRVQEAAATLGFRPNPSARGLVHGRTFTVGLITDDGFGRFSIPVMLGAEDALGAGQMGVFFCDSRDDPIRERHYVAMLLARRVDGLIVTGRVTGLRTPLELPVPIPVVYAMIGSADPTDACVTYDDEAGGRLAVEHLVAMGRRRIAYVTGPRHHHSASARFAGWAAALADAGLLQVRPDLAFGAWSEEWGRQAAVVLAAEVPDLDGVFCGSDQVARGVIDGLREVGRSVPDDVAVVGFDNWDVMVAGRRPMLTSVDPNLHSVGRLAAEHLLAAIDGRPARGVHLIAPRLIVRESSAAAAPTRRRGTSGDEALPGL
jgi:LacI family transcriptional regulator, galactose operon repressor